MPRLRKTEPAARRARRAAGRRRLAKASRALARLAGAHPQQPELRPGQPAGLAAEVRRARGRRRTARSRRRRAPVSASTYAAVRSMRASRSGSSVAARARSSSRIGPGEGAAVDRVLARARCSSSARGMHPSWREIGQPRPTPARRGATAAAAVVVVRVDVDRPARRRPGRRTAEPRTRCRSTARSCRVKSSGSIDSRDPHVGLGAGLPARRPPWNGGSVLITAAPGA